MQSLIAGSENLGTQKTFTVTVRQRDRPPLIAHLKDQQVRAGKNNFFRIVATDPIGEGHPLKFSLEEAPNWVEINMVSGIVSCRPQEADAGKHYLVTVCVENDRSPPLRSVRTLLVDVGQPPRAIAQRPRETPDESPRLFGAQFRLEFPSGRVLVSGGFEISANMIYEGHRLFMLRQGHSPMVVALPRGPTEVFAFCTVAAGSKERLNGMTVVFHPGGDPLAHLSTITNSVRERSPVPPGAQNLIQNVLVRQARALFYDEDLFPGMSDKLGTLHNLPSLPVLWNARPIPFPGVVPYTANGMRPMLCASYQDGSEHAMLMTCRADGTKQDDGEYVKGQANGLACLFANDVLSLVLEYGNDQIQAVHLVSANQLARSFPDETQAAADPAAGRLLREVHRVQSELKDLKKTLSAKVAARATAGPDGDRQSEDRKKTRKKTSSASSPFGTYPRNKYRNPFHGTNSPPTPLLRTWADSAGKYRLDARLLEFKDGVAKLKKTDGTVVSVPSDLLSPADRNYLRQYGGP